MKKIIVTQEEIKMATRPNIYKNKRSTLENQNIKKLKNNSIKACMFQIFFVS
jgi:hypothetical protein